MKTKQEKFEYNNKYISFWFKKWFALTFEVCGYFDNRPRKWSWKGWTIGCSYNLNNWEDPIGCIKRM